MISTRWWVYAEIMSVTADTHTNFSRYMKSNGTDNLLNDVKMTKF